MIVESTSITIYMKFFLSLYLILTLWGRLGLVRFTGDRNLNHQYFDYYYDPVRNQLLLVVDGYFACYSKENLKADELFYNNKLWFDVLNMVIPFTVKVVRDGDLCK